MRVTIEKFMGL